MFQRLSARRGEKGFTLVELLIVIAIIGVLAGVAIPIFLSQQGKAETAAAEADLTSAYKMLLAAEAAGATLPSELPAGQATVLGDMGTITPGTTISVFGSGGDLCVEAALPDGSSRSHTMAGAATGSCSNNPNPGGGGGGGLTLSYGSTVFTTGSNNEVLSPTASGVTGTPTYSVSGTLPDGVTFDTATGTFTGPASSGWNFTATQISAGYGHTCALTSTGGVKCWGWNDYGQLGDGSTTDSLTPVDVSGLTSGVASISGVGSHTCALTTTGGVKCWGGNFYGQLGDGTTTNSSTPVDVSGLSSGVASISADQSQTCAVTTTGGAKCWGWNWAGQLGDGTTTQRTTPVDVSGLTSGVASISAGSSHTCAVTTTGGAKCWGQNDFGQLGDGTTTDSSTPVDVVGFVAGAASISAGGSHTCGIMTFGRARCWGQNDFGQLGNGTTTNSSTPVNVSGFLAGAASISAGGAHTCAVTTTGGAKCWGGNFDGALGDGTTTNSSTPVDVSGLTSGVASISAGSGGHTCAVTTTGGAKCWGWNEYGQLGDGTTVTVDQCYDPWMGMFDPLFETPEDCAAMVGGEWLPNTYAPDSPTPVDVSNTGPQAGFPSTLDVTVTDDAGSTTTSVTLSQS